MNHQEYEEIFEYLWDTFVPRSGQSETVQGELIRANEKLRDEARRNGNLNWSEDPQNCFMLLTNYILDTLLPLPDIPDAKKKQLQTDIERLRDFEYPYTEVDLFERIEFLIIDWYLQNKEPIPRKINPQLSC